MSTFFKVVTLQNASSTRLDITVYTFCPCNYCASMFLISSSNFTHLFSSIIFPSTHPRKGVTSCSSSAPETTSWLNKAMQRRKFSYTSWLLNRRRTWMMWGLTGKADQLHYQKKQWQWLKRTVLTKEEGNPTLLPWKSLPHLIKEGEFS